MTHLCVGLLGRLLLGLLPVYILWYFGGGLLSLVGGGIIVGCFGNRHGYRDVVDDDEFGSEKKFMEYLKDHEPRE